MRTSSRLRIATAIDFEQPMALQAASKSPLLLSSAYLMRIAPIRYSQAANGDGLKAIHSQPRSGMIEKRAGCASANSKISTGVASSAGTPKVRPIAA